VRRVARAESFKEFRRMLIAQISDCHIAVPGVLAYERIDTAQRLKHTIQVLSALDPRPDFVVATGDLVQNGMKSEYAALRAILDPLPMPFFPCLGNHDVRQAFRLAFAGLSDQLEHHGFIQYVIEDSALRLIVLDTVQAGSAEPTLCAARIEWLREALDRSKQPALIAMHHPPFATGVGWVDAKEPEWGAELGSILSSADCVRGIICGHVHRSLHRLWHGIPVSAAPAVAPQVNLQLSPRAAQAFSREPAGFLLHRWDGDQLITYTASVDGFAELFAG
jgi:3',5'-cyclic-AMP phosphodiesterase